MIISFDIGKKYIGISIYSNRAQMAYNLKCLILKNYFIDWKKLDIIIKNYNPQIMITGLSFCVKYTNKNIDLHIINFIFSLIARYTLCLFTVNEYLSTWKAKNTIKKNNIYQYNRHDLINALASGELIKNIGKKNFGKKNDS